MIELFRKEIYELLGELLREGGDEAFVTEGPKIVERFYRSHPGVLEGLATKHAEAGYTRKKLICDDGKHAARCMEWAPSAESPVHEHNGRVCFDIVLQGEIEVVDYEPVRVPGEGEHYMLKEVRRYRATEGDFVAVHPEKDGFDAHSVKSSKERSKSLHFYPVDHRSFYIYRNVKGDLFERVVHEAPDD